MELQKCNTCKKEKGNEEVYTTKANTIKCLSCRDSEKKKHEKYRLNNPKINTGSDKQCHSCGKEKENVYTTLKGTIKCFGCRDSEKKRHETYALNHPEKIKETQKKVYEKFMAKDLEETKDRRDVIRKNKSDYKKRQLENKSNSYYADLHRHKLYLYLSRYRDKKMIAHRAFDTISIDFKLFIKWLEFYISEVKEKTWSIDNYGKEWTIDHLIPLSTFDLTKEEDIRKSFHWTNLRPLSKSENSKKIYPTEEIIKQHSLIVEKFKKDFDLVNFFINVHIPRS
jgi:hypothetical protein